MVLALMLIVYAALAYAAKERLGLDEFWHQRLTESILIAATAASSVVVARAGRRVIGCLLLIAGLSALITEQIWHWSVPDWERRVVFVSMLLIGLGIAFAIGAGPIPRQAIWVADTVFAAIILFVAADTVDHISGTRRPVLIDVVVLAGALAMSLRLYFHRRDVVGSTLAIGGLGALVAEQVFHWATSAVHTPTVIVCLVIAATGVVVLLGEAYRHPIKVERLEIAIRGLWLPLLAGVILKSAGNELAPQEPWRNGIGVGVVVWIVSAATAVAAAIFQSNSEHDDRAVVEAALIQVAGAGLGVLVIAATVNGLYATNDAARMMLLSVGVSGASLGALALWALLTVAAPADGSGPWPLGPVLAAKPFREWSIRRALAYGIVRGPFDSGPGSFIVFSGTVCLIAASLNGTPRAFSVVLTVIGITSVVTGVAWLAAALVCKAVASNHGEGDHERFPPLTAAGIGAMGIGLALLILSTSESLWTWVRILLVLPVALCFVIVVGAIALAILPQMIGEVRVEQVDPDEASGVMGAMVIAAVSLVNVTVFDLTAFASVFLAVVGCVASGVAALLTIDLVIDIMDSKTVGARSRTITSSDGVYRLLPLP